MAGVYCTVCHEFTETPVLYKGKKYCKKCYNNLTVLKPSSATIIGSEDRNKLFQYLKDIFSLGELPDSWVFELDKEVKNTSYSYKEVQDILYYFFEIKRGYASQDYGPLWIIRTYQREAEVYFQKLQKLAEYNASVDITPIENVVQIHSPVSKKKRIDISNL